jgi:hypothetical protein
MIRRLLFGFSGLLALIGLARADEPRYTPAVGTTLTYRVLVAAKSSSGASIISGTDYVYTVTASDGVTTQAGAKVLAMLAGCPDPVNKSFCEAPLKAPGAHRDGDLIVVPIPDDIAEAFAKQSQVTFRRYLVRLALPRLKLSDDRVAIGPDPLIVLTNSFECDAALQAFLPFGQVPKTSVRCKRTTSQTPGPGTQFKPSDSSDAVSLELSDGGADHTTLASGTWEVRKLAFTFVPADNAHPKLQGEVLFSTKLGVSVKTHGTVTSPAAPSEETTTELLAVTQ